MRIGTARLGRHRLGTISRKHSAIIRWMEFETEYTQLSGSVTQVIPDMIFETSYNKIFAQIQHGGYLFVTIQDQETTYRLSFEGIETE